MQRKKRSPGVVAAAAVVGVMVGLPVAAVGDGRDRSTAAGSIEPGDIISPSGIRVRGAFSDHRTAAVSCDRGKRFVAAGPSFVARGSVKSLIPSCYSCCEGFVFVDDFESGDPSQWSASIP